MEAYSEHIEDILSNSPVHLLEHPHVASPEAREHLTANYGYDDDENAHSDNPTHSDTGLVGLDVTSNPRSPKVLFSGVKRQAINCGTFVMDCYKARGACNNACYYQNCIMAGQTVTYRDGGAIDTDAARNRAQSGVTVTGDKVPCRALPITQKMWDTWPNWSTINPRLETDEWPMAAMLQDDFTQGTVRNTIRCIPYKENRNGGNQLMQWRNGLDNWRPAGKYGHHRTCMFTLQRGWEYQVSFDLSGFPTQQEKEEVVPYCLPNPNCANDGRQFHLSKYVVAGVDPGKTSWSWDIENMNNYEMTGEGQPMEAFQVILRRTGANEQDVEVTVSKYRNSQLNQVGKIQQKNVADGVALIVKGLPRDLRVVHQNSKTYFEYGSQSDPRDRLAFFAFNTQDAGFGRQFIDRQSRGTLHRYCVETFVTDAQGNRDGTQWECWFPGW